MASWLHDQGDKIDLQLSKPMDSKRKSAQNPETIDCWFQRFQREIIEYGITADRLWNFDETGFRVGCPKGVHVYVPKGASTVSNP